LLLLCSPSSSILDVLLLPVWMIAGTINETAVERARRHCWLRLEAVALYPLIYGS
jgi:hypothetical protein